MNIIGWVYKTLVADSALVAALGSSDQILREYPDLIDATPIVSFSEANNRDASFYDNQPLSASSAVDIHVFTDFETPTSTIADLVSNTMRGILFTRDYQADMDDPSQKIRHKVMKFSRDNIVAGNLQ